MAADSVGTAVITYTISTPECSNAATFGMTVIPAPLFSLGENVTPVNCAGSANGRIGITVSNGVPPYEFVWSNGIATANASNLSPGFYTVYVTELATQCTITDTITITQPDSLLAIALATSDSCQSGNGSMSATVTGGTPPYVYAWSNGETGSKVVAVAAGSYSVTITDSLGCTHTQPVAVAAQPCSEVVVHDVVTPNGDGKNDTWMVEGLQNYPKNTVQIFDKYGDVVYDHQKYDSDWSGIATNGTPLPDGTYYYLIKLNAPNAAGRENILKGTVLIKR